MIQTVRAQVDGQWYTLTYNPETDAYEVDFTPSRSSVHQPGGVYVATVTAATDNGRTVTVDGSMEGFENLRLKVEDRTTPSLKLVSPQPGFLNTAQPTFTFYAIDDPNGSGINPDSLEITVDVYDSLTLTVSGNDSSGYTFCGTPSRPLSEWGSRSVTARAADYDGNVISLTVEYMIDVTPPTITIGGGSRGEEARQIVDTPTVKLHGFAYDMESGLASFTASSDYMGTVTVPADIEWEFDFPVDIGVNDFTFTAVDNIGHQATKAWRVVRLITDRTQEDLDFATELNSKGWAGMTADERELYLAGLRGAYNACDINRVGYALEILYDALRRYWEFYPRLSIMTQWIQGNIPTAKQLDEWYLRNVKKFWQGFHQHVPTLPETMSFLNILYANEIERGLVWLDENIHRLKWGPMESAPSCGESLCGSGY